MVPADIDERNREDLLPEQYVVHCAGEKARSLIGKVLPEDLVVGADTVVVLDGVIFGKPKDAADARGILSRLSGRTHQVLSAVVLVSDGVCTTELVETKVTLATLTSSQIERYVDTGEPLDKAGAYAIQGLGAIFVERIEGCYSNVVGLPLQVLAKLLTAAGVRLP